MDEKVQEGKMQKPKDGKWMTFSVRTTPEVRALLDTLCAHEGKKIKPLFEDMLVSYIQQKYNEEIQAVEEIDADMRNTKQIIGEISSSLEYQKDDRERKMMQSSIDTFERYYGVLLARKNCCLEEANAYLNILKGDNVKEVPNG